MATSIKLRSGETLNTRSGNVLSFYSDVIIEYIGNRPKAVFLRLRSLGII